ncbi:MAG: hypothetical protein N4A36_00565 [Candidatus Gracilibacteria bacterium]|jgi:4-diphosphocytidyl-2-C-methyl-D-erythritol kinase|nr:hypothetical protein [Candidatus Gracilibacteria bacterium]
MNNINVLAPAKINLDLKIGDLLPSSLHEIKTTMQTIDLFDEIFISFDPKRTNQKIKINLKGLFTSNVPANSDNTIYKAAKLFSDKTGINNNIEITLTKNIPSRSGLGSASSDAASVFWGLERLFNKKADIIPHDLCEIGSDVPFFYHGAPNALIEGVGEKISQKSPQGFYCLICMYDGIFIDTAWAYKKATDNFEEPIFSHFPDLKNLKQKLLDNGAKKAMMSGSGSSVYGIYENKADIDCAFSILNQDSKISYIKKTKSLLHNCIFDLK